MSNYEVYITQRKLLEQAIADINLSLGRDTKGVHNNSNDKHELSFGVGEMGYGYSGSSSYYTINNKIAKEYLVTACQSLRSTIGNTAIQNININIEKLRLAAEAEAKEVLQTVQVK